MREEKRGISYRDAGVDIDAADRMVGRMSEVLKETWTEGVGTDFGGFAAAFSPPWKEYRDPRLLACTDGVGTKLRLLAEAGMYREAGRDCAGMVINDLITAGARPLFFLDYIAAARLEEGAVLGIVEGLAAACKEAGCALIGGETAEMPGYYAPGDYEVVGFAVGMAEGAPGTRRPPEAGDVLVGIPSTGPHSNGFSLVRRILEAQKWSLADSPEGLEGSLAEHLLRATPIYADVVLPSLEDGSAVAAAHITGGGIPGNLPRALPEHLEAEVDWDSWPRPPVFEWLAAAGPVTEEEMRRTFNLGVGMVLVVPPSSVEAVLERTRGRGRPGWVMGAVRAKETGA